MKKFFVITFSILFLCSLLHSTNVIIIAVDTLRADHLGCYGYPRNTSPNIDKFAMDAVRFKNCYTPSPLTTPAFVSMLSSLLPHRHGAKRNGMSIFDNGFETYNIEKDKFELSNIYKNPDGEMKIMSDLLRKYMMKVQKFIKYSKKYLKQNSEFSKEDLEKLKSFGYIDHKK